MNNFADRVGMFCLFLFFVCVSANIGRCSGEEDAKKTHEESAVKAGAAVWVSDEKGKPIIKWLVPNPEKK